MDLSTTDCFLNTNLGLKTIRTNPTVFIHTHMHTHRQPMQYINVMGTSIHIMDLLDWTNSQQLNKNEQHISHQQFSGSRTSMRKRKQNTRHRHIRITNIWSVLEPIIREDSSGINWALRRTPNEIRVPNRCGLYRRFSEDQGYTCTH